MDEVVPPLPLQMYNIVYIHLGLAQLGVAAKLLTQLQPWPNETMLAATAAITRVLMNYFHQQGIVRCCRTTIH